MITLSGIGLLCIALAWIYQLFLVVKGSSKIKPVFVGLYAIGVALLVIDDLLLKGSFSAQSILNALSFAAVATMFVLLIERKQ